MTRWPASRALAVGAAAAVFVACSILPVAYLVTTSIAGGATSLPWPDGRQRGLLWTTTLVGAGAAAGATVLGVPLGAALARVPLPHKAAMRLALAAPVVLPPYIVALAWTFLGGPRGFLTALAGRDLLGDWTYSLPAAIVVSSLLYYPLSMLATEMAMRRIDGRLEEAGLIAAPSPAVLARITLPLTAPSVLAAALLVFVLAVSDFGVPAVLRVRVYTTEVFTAFAALYDAGRAIVVAVPLVLLSVVVASVAVGISGGEVITSRRPTGAQAPLLAGARRPAAVMATVVCAMGLGLPLLLLAREAAGARSLTGALAGSGTAIAGSLVQSAIGATAVVAVAVLLGYARARAAGTAGRIADIVFVVAFAVPSTVVGVGLIGLWNRPGVLGAAYGTDAMLLLGHLARFVPVAALILAATLRSVPVSHEEAAAVSGAGWARSFARVVLPQVRFGMLAVWALAFVLAFGELGVSVLVAPHGDATLPIRIYTLVANTPASHVAALALLQAAVVLSPLAVAAAASRSRS